MNQIFVILFLILLCGIPSTLTQSSSCALCRQLFSAISSQLGNEEITKEAVQSTVEGICDTFFLQSWCEENLYPFMDDVFYAMRSKETPSVVCERLNLCHFKILSIRGNILFAERDRLDMIIPIGENTVQRREWGKINHPELSVMNISGLACGTDYCTLLLKGIDKQGQSTFGITALSSATQRHHVLSRGAWYGPWYDIHTNQFWLAVGNAKNLTFGQYDTQYGQFVPKINMRLRVDNSKILSGMILDRVLYYTLLNDPHVWVLDIATHIFRTNYSAPANTMLVGNPVTNEMYGYTPGPEGIFRFDDKYRRTTIVGLNFSGAKPVPSSTINPIDNVMWISLWGGPSHDAWMKIYLAKTSDNVRWAPVANLEGFFDFNPEVIKSEEV